MNARKMTGCGRCHRSLLSAISVRLFSTPRSHQQSLFGFLRALYRNPMERWTLKHFEQPLVTMSLAGRRVMLINDPAAIKHVLLRQLPLSCHARPQGATRVKGKTGKSERHSATDQEQRAGCARR
jgi:hypothetical protein